MSCVVLSFVIMYFLFYFLLTMICSFMWFVFMFCELVSVFILLLCVLITFRIHVDDFILLFCFFFFKLKTAYEWRISDWSSDVCSSDLGGRESRPRRARRPANGG